MGEIVKYDANYLSQLSAGADDELAQMAAECDPLSAMPKLILPSDGTTDMKCVLNDDTLFSKKRVAVFVVFLGARRALWQPEGRDAESNAPICSTGVVSAGTFNRRNDQGVGKWKVEGNEDLPFWSDSVEESKLLDTADVPCRLCKWNQFESAPQWDESKQGKGKACSEGRLLALRIADKIDSMETPNGEEIGIFTYNDSSPLVLMNIPSTSIKTIRQMCSAATARKIPMSRLVWNFSADKHENGSRSWSVLGSELAGFAGPAIIGALDDDKKDAEAIFTQKFEPVLEEEEVPF